MASRRGRRTRGTWLPPTPTVLGENPNSVTWFQSNLSLVSAIGADDQAAIPLITDETLNPGEGQLGGRTLRDIVEGQSYVLKRAVGKFWGAGEQDADTDVGRVILCAALAVLPVDDASPSSPAMDAQDWHPLFVQNAMAPFLWRRTWILSNNVHPSQSMFYPNSTAAYGSVADGGHIDTKGTARRIDKEQRLFLLIGAQVLETLGAGVDTYNISYGYDLRFFGELRKSRNRSSFK